MTPVVRPKLTKVQVKLPPGVWYDFSTGEVVGSGEGGMVEVAVGLEGIPVMIRGGSILVVR